jgi:hypothetical protein
MYLKELGAGRENLGTQVFSVPVKERFSINVKIPL